MRRRGCAESQYYARSRFVSKTPGLVPRRRRSPKTQSFLLEYPGPAGPGLIFSVRPYRPQDGKCDSKGKGNGKAAGRKVRRLRAELTTNQNRAFCAPTKVIGAQKARETGRRRGLCRSAGKAELPHIKVGASTVAAALSTRVTDCVGERVRF